MKIVEKVTMAIRQIDHFQSPRTKPQRHAVCKTPVLVRQLEGHHRESSSNLTHTARGPQRGLSAHSDYASIERITWEGGAARSGSSSSLAQILAHVRSDSARGKDRLPPPPLRGYCTGHPLPAAGGSRAHGTTCPTRSCPQYSLCARFECQSKSTVASSPAFFRMGRTPAGWSRM